MIGLALYDAAKNAAEHSNVENTVTLRSGAQIVGRLQRSDIPSPDTYIMQVGRWEHNGFVQSFCEEGWCTIAVAEVAAVESRYKQ